MTTRRHTGLSLVEAMLSLAISAPCWSPSPPPFPASAAAIETNDRFFRATQAARVTIAQIVNDVRQCQSGSFTSTECDIFTTAAQHRVYFYNATEQKLQMKLTDLNPIPVYTLAHDVVSATFNSDGHSLAITLTV